MMHRSLMEPPGKAKKAGMDGGGGEPHHPQVAALAREAMIEDSSLTGSGKKKAVQHHGSVGFLLASHALTGSENKKSSIFGQGANHVVDQTKTANKKAVAGQNAQGAGWGNVFWAANQGESPTLKLVMDVDRNMISLLEHIAELGSWRSMILEEKLLPLGHFTTFTVLTSRLCRAKGELSKSVGYLLRQVRCLLFDTTGDDMLARELARIKADPTNQLEERVEQLSDQLDEAKVQLHQERGLSRWKGVLIQVGARLEEEQQNTFKRKMEKYILKVKDQNRPENIVDEKLEGVDDAGAGDPEVIKKKKGMIKKQAEKLEKREQGIEKREAKLLAERQSFTEAVQAYEAQQAEEEAELAAHIEALKAADAAHAQKVEELEKAKKQIETDNDAMHQRWLQKATLLVEKEKYADERYPELVTFEEEVKSKLAHLETLSKEMLFGIQSSEHAGTLAKAASQSLKYATDKQESIEAERRKTLEMSENQTAVLIPPPVLADAKVQTDEVVFQPKSQFFSRNSSGESHAGMHSPLVASSGSPNALSLKIEGFPNSPSAKYGGKVMSMKSGVAQSPYGSIKHSSPVVPSMDDDIASYRSPGTGYRSPGMRSAKASVSMPGSPLDAMNMTPLKSLSLSDDQHHPPVMSLKSSSEAEDNVGRGKGGESNQGGGGKVMSGGDDEGLTRTLSDVGDLKSNSPPDSPMMHRRSPKGADWGEPTVTPLTRSTKEKISSIIDAEPVGITTVRNVLEGLPGHLTDMVKRIVSDPGFKDISSEVSTSMSLQPPATTNETVEARLRLVEEREAHATKIETKMAEMEREHAAMLEKKKAAEAKVSEIMANEDDREFQMEKRSLELEKLKEDLEERERAVSKRAKEADESVELLEREKAFFDDKVANLLGSKQGRASLSKLMSLEAREREVASLESQKADLVKNAEALQKKMEAYETQKANVDKRETEVEHLNGQIEMAIAEAAEEQSLFEASVESRNEELNQRKKQLDAFWLEIKDQVEVNEGRKEVTEKLAKLMEREYKVRVKEEQLERREEGLEEERKKEETRVKVMLLKANEEAEAAARHAVRKREEEVTAKEGEVNRRLIELDKKLAKSKDLEVQAKTTQEIQEKNKQVEEKLKALEAREDELGGYMREIEQQKKEIKALAEGVEGSGAAKMLAQDEKVKSLVAEKKELMQKSKTMEATIQKLEMAVVKLEADRMEDNKKMQQLQQKRASMSNIAPSSQAGDVPLPGGGNASGDASASGKGGSGKEGSKSATGVKGSKKGKKEKEKEEDVGVKGGKKGGGKDEAGSVSGVGKAAKKQQAKEGESEEEGIEAWGGEGAGGGDSSSSKPASRGSSRGLSRGGVRRGKLGYSASDLDEQAKKLMALQRELALKEEELTNAIAMARQREDERNKAIIVKEKEIEAARKAIDIEKTEAHSKARKVEQEIHASIEKMVQEHETQKRALKAKQERLMTEVQEVENQHRHLSELRQSAEVLEVNFQAIAESGDAAMTLDENLERQKAMIQLGEITIKHLGVLHDVYADKLKIIDAEVRKRKRSSQLDAKSQLNKETVSALASKPRAALERAQAHEHNFLVQAMLAGEDNHAPLDDSSKHVLRVGVIAPSPFFEAPPGGDLILPKIGHNKPTLGGSSRGGVRDSSSSSKNIKGGGFRNPRRGSDKLHSAMSEKSGIAGEMLSAEEKKALHDEVAHQMQPGSRRQQPETPGSVTGFPKSPGGIPASPGQGSLGFSSYVQNERSIDSDDGERQQEEASNIPIATSHKKGQFFAGGVSTPDSLVPKSWGAGVTNAGPVADSGPNILGVGSRGVSVESNGRGGVMSRGFERRDSSPGVGGDKRYAEIGTPKKPTHFWP